jgi:hypothetical protein
LEGGRARWQSPADRGDEAASPNTLFVPLQPSVAYIGQLVKSLAAQGGSAPAIGGATLSLERLTTVEVSGPMGKVPLALLAVTGADASPWYSWHRDDASLELIGVVWPGFHVLEKEYAGAVELLLKAQVRAEDDRLMRIQKRLARPLAGLTVIRGVRWFDAPAAQMHGPSDVYVFAGRIAHIGPPGELDVTVDQSIDGAGRTLLPGLFDMHGHIWSSAGPQYLAGGVTSVRELAGENSEILRLRDRIAAGDLPGHLPGRLHRREEPVLVAQRFRRRDRGRGQTSDRLVCRARLSADQALQLDPAGVGGAFGRLREVPWNDGHGPRAGVHAG